MTLNNKEQLLKIAKERKQPSKFIIINDDGSIETLKDAFNKQTLDFDLLSEQFDIDKSDLLHLYVISNYTIPGAEPMLYFDEKIKKHINLLELKDQVDFDNVKLLFPKVPVNYIMNSFMNLLKKKLSADVFKQVHNKLKPPNFTFSSLKQLKQILKQYDNKNILVNDIFGNLNIKFYKDILKPVDIQNMMQKLPPLSRAAFIEQLYLFEDDILRNQEKIIKNTIDTTEGVPYERFNIKKNEYRVDIKFPHDYKLEYIFDNMKTNFPIKYIKFNDYFKIFKKFDPPKEWISEDIQADTIFIRLDEINVLIKLVIEDGNYYLNTVINKESIKIEYLLELVKDVFLIPYRVENIQVFNIIGNYYIPNFAINRFIMSHIVLLNPVLSKYLVKNDNVFVTSVSKNRNINSLNLRYSEPNSDNTMVVKVSSRIVTKSEVDLIDKPDVFKINSHFVKVSLSGKKIIDINNFQQLFSKFLTIYKSKENEFFTYYKHYIPDFQLYPKIANTKDVLDYNLRDYAPYIFKRKFSSFCKPDRNPIIVDIYDKSFIESIPDNKTFISNLNKYEKLKLEDKDTKKIEEKIEIAFNNDDRFLLFPKDNSIGPRLWFYCGVNKNTPNIGLIKNQTENSDQLKVLPCCFKKPQKDNKLFKAYNVDEVEKIVKTTTNIRFVTTKKFLNEDDQLGTLPDEIVNFFNTTGLQENNIILRKGTSNSTSTFLECILFAINYKEYQNVNKTLRKAITDNERAKLGNLDSYNFAKQECYDMTYEEIKNIISNTFDYLDPLKFVKVLEFYYDIDIYMFSRQGEQTYYTLPSHINGYYRLYDNTDKKSVIIYQHNGGLWTNQDKCELILTKNIKENIPDVYLFDRNDELIRNIFFLEAQLNRFFILQKQVTLSMYPPGTITKQYIDSYGKTRVIIVDGIYIFTPPLPPLNLPLLDMEASFVENDIKLVLKYTEKYNINITSQNINNLTLQFEYENQKFNINVNSRYKNNVNKLDTMIPISSTDNSLDNFIFLEKYSRQLFEFILYKYSNFLYEENKDNDKSSLNKFFLENIIIKPNNEYNLFNYILEENDIDKIELENIQLQQNIKKKLIVFLTNNNINRVLSYYQQQYMDNYYKNIYDFKKYKHTTILKGSQSIYQWVDSMSSFNITNELPQFDNDVYISDDELYIKYPVNSLDNAKYIGKVWFEHGYIPLTGEIETDYRLTITHFFLDQEDREPSTRMRGNISNKYQIKVFGYVKKFKKTSYEVLLNIKFRKEPLFIRHGNESEKTIYMLQQGKDLENAKKIAVFYKEYNFNPYSVEDKIIDTNINYRLYTVNDESKISLDWYDVIENDNNDDNNVKIVRQQIKSKNIYYAMLDI